MKFKQKFAMCLSGSISANGVVFFGDGPYRLLPDIDASQFLKYAPLYIKPFTVATGEYFFQKKRMEIGGRAILFNRSLLPFEGGGLVTRISTEPYTVMVSSIYEAFTDAFIRAAGAMNISPVASVYPFEACFRADEVHTTSLGPSVPTIDMILQNNSVWRIFGPNSMVRVNDKVICLAFVAAGAHPRDAIVIGAQQLEDNLLQFDIQELKLGFSSETPHSADFVQ